MSLKEKFVSGVYWSTGANVIQQMLAFAISIILARHLLPRDYGLIAMVLVFTGAASMLVEAGFHGALVQHQELQPRHTNSVFWVNAAAASAFTIAFYFAAPLIADFYATPALEPMTRWLSLMFGFGAIRIVQEALLLKSMAFQRLAKIEVFSQVIPGVLAIYLAVIGWGVWSLVVQYLAHQAMKSALVWFYSAWRPQLRFSYSAVRELFGYSANLTGGAFISYWAGQADTLLIGKFMDSSGLGVYTRARSLIMIPIIGGTQIISTVMFSILSSIQNDKERVKRTYLRATRMMAFVTFPLMLGLFAVADPFVLALLGPNWTAVAPLMQILCYFGITQTLCYPTRMIFMSQGRTDVLLRWNVVNAVVLIVAIIVGVWFGTIKAVALAYLIANIALAYPCITIAGKLIGLTFVETIEYVAGVFGCAAAMAVGVWGLGLALPSEWSVWAILAIQIPSGIASYAAIAWLANVDAFAEFKDVAWQLRRKPKIASSYG